MSGCAEHRDSVELHTMILVESRGNPSTALESYCFSHLNRIPHYEKPWRSRPAPKSRGPPWPWSWWDRPSRPLSSPSQSATDTSSERFTRQVRGTTPHPFHSLIRSMVSHPRTSGSSQILSVSVRAGHLAHRMVTTSACHNRTIQSSDMQFERASDPMGRKTPHTASPGCRWARPLARIKNKIIPSRPRYKW